MLFSVYSFLLKLFCIYSRPHGNLQGDFPYFPHPFGLQNGQSGSLEELRQHFNAVREVVEGSRCFLGLCLVGEAMCSVKERGEPAPLFARRRGRWLGQVRRSGGSRRAAPHKRSAIKERRLNFSGETIPQLSCRWPARGEEGKVQKESLIKCHFPISLQKHHEALEHTRK